MTIQAAAPCKIMRRGKHYCLLRSARVSICKDAAWRLWIPTLFSQTLAVLFHARIRLNSVSVCPCTIKYMILHIQGDSWDRALMITVLNQSLMVGTAHDLRSWMSAAGGVEFAKIFMVGVVIWTDWEVGRNWNFRCFSCYFLLFFLCFCRWVLGTFLCTIMGQSCQRGEDVMPKLALGL